LRVKLVHRNIRSRYTKQIFQRTEVSSRIQCSMEDRASGSQRDVSLRVACRQSSLQNTVIQRTTITNRKTFRWIVRVCISTGLVTSLLPLYDGSSLLWLSDIRLSIHDGKNLEGTKSGRKQQTVRHGEDRVSSHWGVFTLLDYM
jgi:hypothetical protein